MNDYSPTEERLNVWSHALGLILSFIATFFLVQKAAGLNDLISIFSVVVFGLSLILLYAASTFYHNAKSPKLRKRLKIFDHAAIYVLIAGTYTPFTLLVLKGDEGDLIFNIIWGMAIVGVIIKLFFTGRFKLISTLMYVFMGWVIIFAINPLVESLSSDGLFWLFLGGVVYTLGAILYSIKKIKFNHAIFHFFVLMGSFCHVYAVYNHIL